MRVGIDVGEDGRPPHIDHRVRGRGKSDAGDDHLIAGPDSQGVHGRVQSGRPAVDGHRLASSHGESKGLLELGDPWAGRQPVRLQHGGHGRAIVVVDRLVAVRQIRLANRLAAADRQFPFERLRGVRHHDSTDSWEGEAPAEPSLPSFKSARRSSSPSHSVL